MPRPSSKSPSAAKKSPKGVKEVTSKSGAAGKNKYSVLLPTYNERENLPLMVALLDDVFTSKFVLAGALHRF